MSRYYLQFILNYFCSHFLVAFNCALITFHLPFHLFFYFQLSNRTVLFVLINKIRYPPRMRVLPLPKRNLILPQRITPAYGGITVSQVVCLGFIRDHPRLCGYNFLPWPVCKGIVRITPACAGITV